MQTFIERMTNVLFNEMMFYLLTDQRLEKKNNTTT